MKKGSDAPSLTKYKCFVSIYEVLKIITVTIRVTYCCCSNGSTNSNVIPIWNM